MSFLFNMLVLVLGGAAAIFLASGDTPTDASVSVFGIIIVGLGIFGLGSGLTTATR